MSAIANKFGKHMAKPSYFASLGEGMFSHRFGGTTWIAKVDCPIGDSPLLLFVFDLSDERILGRSLRGISELPVFSFVNSSAWEGKQAYKIDPVARTTYFEELDVERPEIYDKEDRLPNPTEQKSIILSEIPDDLLCLDEDSYWNASNDFLGGNTFIRVGGSPVWLDRVCIEYCECGKVMQYFCSIGYENPESSSFVKNIPLFWGEGSLYYFFCEDCERVSVVCQSS